MITCVCHTRAGCLWYRYLLIAQRVRKLGMLNGNACWHKLAPVSTNWSEIQWAQTELRQSKNTHQHESGAVGTIGQVVPIGADWRAPVPTGVHQ
eukprot:6059218-Alexandrium_andersonii.AAC.1